MISIPFILLGCVLVLLVIELAFVRGLVRKIPLRIHVNGSRGKSTVTRYIVAGLRSGGKKTLGKITGIIPTLMLPDERREIINRRGPANIREQLKMIRLASRHSCDAIVLECMSIASVLQQTETRMLQPHITILTNILEDHLEELGNSDLERTEAYCSALPKNAIVITNDSEHIFEVEKAASAGNSRVILARNDDFDLSAYSFNPIAKEHILLALSVCKIVGIDERKALDAIINEMRSEESLLYTIPFGDSSIRFVNGFAVNDVNSGKRFLDTWKERLGAWQQLVFIINTRNDRPRRTLEFAKWCCSTENLNSVILTGTHIPLMKRMLRRYGFNEENIYEWSAVEVQTPQQYFVKNNNIKGTTIFGFGNIAGAGFTILEALKNYQNHETEVV